MIYHSSFYIKPYLSIFNVVQYVSFRMIAALLTTLICSIFFGDWFIGKSRLFFRSKTREFTPDTHRIKDDMPTMGGIFIIVMVLSNIILWCDLTDVRVWLFILNMIGFGLIGFWDDWSKIKKSKGISALMKFTLQCLVAALVGCILIVYGQVPATICFPFFKSACMSVGLWYSLWATLVIVGCSNAVNLTDGLDGLAIGSLIPNFATFSIIAYVVGNHFAASYLRLPFAPTDQLAIIGAILVGAGLGFLWFNAYPAQIFMGDVGSLALGSSLAFIALAAKQEMLLLIAGGLFVLETVSVIMQVASFKLFGRKIFRMAPLHHHFELLGWPESRITVRFGIISCVLSLLALMTLKLR